METRLIVEASGKVLRIRFVGRFGVAEIAPYAVEIARVLPSVPAGFTLLTDLTDLASMELECAPHIERAMDLCRRHGVQLIVRVVPDPARDIGFNIMSLFHYPESVQIITCPTRAEAEKLLA